MISRVFDSRLTGVGRSQFNYTPILDTATQLVHAVIGEHDFCIVHDIYPNVEGTTTPGLLHVPIRVISPFFNSTTSHPPQVGVRVQDHILFIGIRLHDLSTVYFPYEQLLEYQTQGRIITDLDDASSRRSSITGILNGSLQEALLDKILGELDGSSVTSHVLGLPLSVYAKIGEGDAMFLHRDATGEVTARDIMPLTSLADVEDVILCHPSAGSRYHLTLTEVEATLLQWAKTHQRDFDDCVCNGRVTITPETVHIDIANRVDQTALYVINEMFLNVSYPGSPGTP